MASRLNKGSSAKLTDDVDFVSSACHCQKTIFCCFWDRKAPHSRLGITAIRNSDEKEDLNGDLDVMTD